MCTWTAMEQTLRIDVLFFMSNENVLRPFSGDDLQSRFFQVCPRGLAWRTRTLSLHRLPQLATGRPHLWWGEANKTVGKVARRRQAETLKSRVFFWSGYLWHGRLHVLHLLQVSVFGFGADQYGNWHHYWEENHLAGAFRHTGIHNGDYEYNVTLLLADKQKIRMFKGRWYVDDQPVNAAFGFFRRGLMFLLINRRSFCPRAIDEAKATLPVVS